jgi:predicted transcriptional regulator
MTILLKESFVVVKNPGGNSPRTSDCSTKGCHRKTSEGKPYCLQCLDQLPYVNGVKKAIETRKSETARAACGEWQHIDLQGTYCSDILTLLRKKAMSPKKLALMVDVPLESMDSYLKALRHAGLVKTFALKVKPTKPNQPRKLVAITDEGRQAATILWESR